MNELFGAAVDSAFFRAIFDAVPSPALIVDEDVRIIDFNAAAASQLATAAGAVLRGKSGEVLHCVHSIETSEGCGHSEACKDCIVRNSVAAAFSGSKMARQKSRMEIRRDGKVSSVEMLVTAAPFTHGGRKLVLLVLEDISELLTLRGLLPICAQCKKIRDDQNYWQRLETYLSEHLSLDFTHGLCPNCARELFPDYVPPAPSRPA
jgi:PAS domain-containing protein